MWNRGGGYCLAAGEEFLSPNSSNSPKFVVDRKLKKRAVHRAKILEGQMRGLTRAIEEEKYCIDLLRHSLSIQKSLRSLNVLLLEQHLRRHVKHQMKSVQSEERAIKELLEVFELHNK